MVNAIWNSREAGIYPNCTYIFGFPGETVETLKETSFFMKETQTQNKLFCATPYPKTELFHSVYKAGKIIGPWEEFDFEAYIMHLGDAQQYTINLTRWPIEEALALKKLCEDGQL